MEPGSLSKNGKVNNKIVVILGPTASGKSDVAIRLAQEFNGEVISADSRQIYRGMDIGSGKISKREQQMAPHYMLDIVSPRTEYSVAKFKKRAEEHIRDILSRDKIPIICGGTGFWIKSIVDNVIFPKVKPNWPLRNKLGNKDAKALFAQLGKLDPQRAKNIDSKNKVRIIRAIEICKSLGSVPKPTARKLSPGPYEFFQIGIEWPKEKLDERIKRNVEKRFKAGMVKEVEDLHEKYKLSWKRIRNFGLSYKLVPEYLGGRIASKAELKEKIYLAEKNYAKRQMTWFKKDSRILWLKNYNQIKKEIEKKLKYQTKAKN